ncbi:lipase family protein [Microbispora sp. NPDC049125]|uniref:lipase family protein n=1 Tax=Microbispora sp. NPDC049125 TaxID=3154929 RepID=UPI0034668E8F
MADSRTAVLVAAVIVISGGPYVAVASAETAAAPRATGTAEVHERAGAAGWQGTPVRVEPLPAAIRLAGAGASWSLRYLSTSWNGRRTTVSGTLSLPSGRPPRDGWPVVSFGHGFGGSADACAPSVTGPSPWERAVQEQLIGAGYAVAVTDFEGIGTPGESPGIDGRAEAHTMVDIVRAARRIAPVSRSWASVGYSLGGHAALFTGALAAAYAPSLRHVGTIAMAPTTQWRVQTSGPAFRDPVRQVNHTIPYTGRSLALTRPGFRVADWYTPKGQELVDLAGRICVTEMLQTVAGVTNGDVLKDPPAADDEFARALADEEIPVMRYPKPVYIVHGADDELPVTLSEMTAGQLAGASSDVTFVPVPGVDHITLLPAVAGRVREWADRLFAHAP